jgi:hypothetical protein
MYCGKGTVVRNAFGVEGTQCTAIAGFMRVVYCSRLLVNTFFVVIRAIIADRLGSW